MKLRFIGTALAVVLCVFFLFFRPLRASITPLPNHGLLYPRESEVREVRSLDGIWTFLKSKPNDPEQGIREKWFNSTLQKVGPIQNMPVPSSYNDITTDETLRDHVGTVWYERFFYVSPSWNFGHRVWLRFGSVHYMAMVWLNGQFVMKHFIGHLPFEMEITKFVNFGEENRLTVLCDNTLLNSTIPQGAVQSQKIDNGSMLVQTYTFDFFNYAGIHRSVHLYTTPPIYIQDINVHTEITADAQNGVIHYEVGTNLLNHNIHYEPSLTPFYLHLQLRTQSGEVVAKDIVHTTDNKAFKGTLFVNNVKLWWPYLMHPNPGYMYTLELYLHSGDEILLDVYRQPVGVRSLRWTEKTLFMNEKPLYLRGFGRHEDSDIRGKGLDLVLLTRDFNLLKWIGANAYRTSHYPYSEESMQFADENGIMIIDECPSVNTELFTSELLKNHKSALQQLIYRDHNHASVIAWSVANEPRSSQPKAEQYFHDITDYARTLDNTRPLTAALNELTENEHLGKFLDIVSFNAYRGWYYNAGHLNMIVQNVIDTATTLHNRHNRPIIMMEYGADTIEGLHFLPSYVWSEDYQSALLSKHFQAFDQLRSQQWFIGEFVWNFADFKTDQNVKRVGGNKKGIFTRNRQPKSAAFLLRQRYHALAKQQKPDYNLPNDLYPYVTLTDKSARIEL